MTRETITDRAHGIDVSHHQEEFVSWKTWGQIDFAIAKVGQGYNTPYSKGILGDPTDFYRLWNDGVSQVDIRGLYLYQIGGYSWITQAEKVLNFAYKLNIKPHMLWCDLEKIGNTIDATMLADTLRILDHWRDEGIYTVGLYTNKDVLQNYIQPIGLKHFGQEWLDRLYAYPLWYAQYWWQPSPNKQPATPYFHSNWNIWQYTDRGDSFEMRDGVRMRHYGSPDLNVYNGSVEEMIAWLKIGKVLLPPVLTRPKVTIKVNWESYGDVDVEVK